MLKALTFVVVKDKDLLKKVGENIARIRKAKGLSIQKLADLCDMERSNLSPIEKGKQNVTLIMLHKIAKALECEVIDFFK